MCKPSPTDGAHQMIFSCHNVNWFQYSNLAELKIKKFESFSTTKVLFTFLFFLFTPSQKVLTLTHRDLMQIHELSKEHTFYDLSQYMVKNTDLSNIP